MDFLYFHRKTDVQLYPTSPPPTHPSTLAPPQTHPGTHLVEESEVVCGEDDALVPLVRPVHHGAAHEDGVGSVEAHEHDLARHRRQEVAHHRQICRRSGAGDVSEGGGYKRVLVVTVAEWSECEPDEPEDPGSSHTDTR